MRWNAFSPSLKSSGLHIGIRTRMFGTQFNTFPSLTITRSSAKKELLPKNKLGKPTHQQHFKQDMHTKLKHTKGGSCNWQNLYCFGFKKESWNQNRLIITEATKFHRIYCRYAFKTGTVYTTSNLRLQTEDCKSNFLMRCSACERSVMENVHH